jgi:putative ATP-dependent endonuclease of OLD family
MHLSGILIENFRGIRRLELALDPTTLLIGENEVGKTAVLEAIKLLLGPWPEAAPPLKPTDHHQPSTGEARGPLRIELFCSESAVGEWHGNGSAQLADASGVMRSGLHGFALGFVAEHGAHHGHWRLRPYRQNEREASAKLVALVRRRCPLLQIRGGDVEGLGEAIEPAGHDQLRATAGRYWQRLANGENDPRGVEDPLDLAGLNLAARILRRCLPHFASDADAIEARVGEALGQADPAQRPAGSAARKLAMLMVAAALSPDGRGTVLQPEAGPILVIDDPESHLHPMTLAALWSLLEAIRLQKLVTTQSGDLLAAAPIASLRRLVRHLGEVRTFRVHTERFQIEELRKFSYHLRVRNGVASFARVWMLVEGETEFWVMSELARMLGYDLAQEGVTCVEFAQCGLPPLIKMANEMGIQWHVLADGDRAGQSYAQSTRSRLGGDPVEERLTLLSEPDIEHCFWEAGFQDVYRVEAGAMHQLDARSSRVIDRAIRRRSKPYLAFAVLAQIAVQGPASIPTPLARLIETCVRLAREAPRRAMQIPTDQNFAHAADARLPDRA